MDGINPWNPLASIKPTIAYLTDQLAKAVPQNSSKDMVDVAKRDKLSAADQALNQFNSANTNYDNLLKLAAGYRDQASTYEDPQVGNVWKQISDVQSHSPVAPVPTTPGAPSFAQNLAAAIGSAISPRMALQFMGDPQAEMDREAKEQDAHNLALYGQQEGQTKSRLSNLSTMLGIAQRGEASKQRTFDSLATKTLTEAGNAGTLGQSYLHNYLTSLDNDLNRGQKDVQFHDRLDLDQQKVDNWVNNKANVLAETVRYHTGVLDQKDADAALGWAKLEAAKNMDSWRQQHGDEQNKIELQKRQDKLVSDGLGLMNKYQGSVQELTEKRGKVDAAMTLLYRQLNDGLAAGTIKADPNDPNRLKLEQQLAAQISLKNMYSKLLSDQQSRIQAAALGVAPGQVQGGGQVQQGQPVGGPTADTTSFGTKTPANGALQPLAPLDNDPNNNNGPHGPINPNAYYGSQDQKPSQPAPRSDGQVKVSGGSVTWRKVPKKGGK